MLVNDSHALAPYRQSALWLAEGGVACLSGVVQVDGNVPYVQWLDALCPTLAGRGAAPARVVAADLPEEVGTAWKDWLPAHGLWLPLGAAEAESPAAAVAGGLLLARELPWTEHDVALLAEWADIWFPAWTQLRRPRAGVLQGLLGSLRRTRPTSPDTPWWRRRWLRWAALAVAVAAMPVRLTVLAPGELVPARPAVIRAPLDGVIDTFHVEPNASVVAGQPLFGFDEALIQSRLDVSRQALSTAEAEYRQTAQQALNDARSKAQLTVLTGKIEEKRAEVAYLAEQLGRARVLAPRDGIALFDDPSEWIGRPVTVGERVMRIATPGDVEVEAWLPLADAIPLDEGAGLSLYLNASPLSPVAARLRYLAHDAVQRPDGGYAYRLRARLEGGTGHRVGLKGTAKVNGRWVPLAYWVLRRPAATLRATLGW